jgi:hypothetical protein
MKNRRRNDLSHYGFFLAITIALLLVLIPTSALAQTYLFSMDEEHADVYINSDGSVSLRYQFVFTNAPSASPIDFVDVGMPTDSFSMTGAQADVNGAPVGVSRSDYQGSGYGFAVVLGSQAIRPGRTGTVNVYIPHIDPWMRVDSEDNTYASLVFSPTWFGKQYLQGTTNMTVIFHLPPGIKPEEPRWHGAPTGFSSEPLTGIDQEGRITYNWGNPQAHGYEQYRFGASFPASYVPASAVVKPTIWETLGISQDTAFTFCCCGGIFAAIIGSGFWSTYAARKRRLQYLPPKVAIEGMGIKRGLTAVEAAILLEEPLDKALTMTLFGLVKKGAATVVSRDPLKIQATTPQPEGLYDYEKDFLSAFAETTPKAQRAALQTMTINLIKSVSTKMKGFSRKETIAYYKDITERAWKQVESAQTPEVKSETFDKYMEWTMLDREYDDRTRRTFTGPIFVPTWWGHYDPTYHAPSTPSAPSISRPSGVPASLPSPGSAGRGGLPSLPGSAFAASMVHGVQNFSSGVMGNITDFTSGVTNKTNPVPIATRSGGGWSSGGGGGHSCACACACAGCACACAGGGR